MPQPHQSFFQGISQRIAMAPFWALGDFAELVARVQNVFFFFFKQYFFLKIVILFMPNTNRCIWLPILQGLWFPENWGCQESWAQQIGLVDTFDQLCCCYCNQQTVHKKCHVHHSEDFIERLRGLTGFKYTHANFGADFSWCLSIPKFQPCCPCTFLLCRHQCQQFGNLLNFRRSACHDFCMTLYLVFSWFSSVTQHVFKHLSAIHGITDKTEALKLLWTLRLSLVVLVYLLDHDYSWIWGCAG